VPAQDTGLEAGVEVTFCWYSDATYAPGAEATLEVPVLEMPIPAECSGGSISSVFLFLGSTCVQSLGDVRWSIRCC